MCVLWYWDKKFKTQHNHKWHKWNTKTHKLTAKRLKAAPKDTNPQHSDAGRLQGDNRMTTKHREIIAEAQNDYDDTMINIHKITTKRWEIWQNSGIFPQKHTKSTIETHKWLQRDTHRMQRCTTWFQRHAEQPQIRHINWQLTLTNQAERHTIGPQRETN